VELWLRDINMLFCELQQHVYVFVFSACVFVEGFELADQVPVACTDVSGVGRSCV
jgi:hypothetical protein